METVYIGGKSTFLQDCATERDIENNLLLNVSRTTELIVDFRGKEATTHTPVYIIGAGADEQFLNINIPGNLH